MTETKDEIVGVVYFSDTIVCAVQTHGAQLSEEPERYVRLPGRILTAGRYAREDIEAAAEELTNLAKGRMFKGVCLLCDGPFLTVDKSDRHYGTVSAIAPTSRWRDINVIETFKQKLNVFKADYSQNTEFILFNRPSAVAFGEYFTANQDRLAQAKTANENMLDVLADIGNNLFVIIGAQGISAALIVEGEPFRGETTLTMGHHSVNIIEEPMPFMRCEDHPQRPCLNSLASHKAIKERWNMDIHDFISCTDRSKVYLIAFYIAQALSNMILCLSPKKITVFGECTKNSLFIDCLRESVRSLLQREADGLVYPGYDAVQDLGRMIVKAESSDPGIKGGFILMQRHFAKLRTMDSLSDYKAAIYNV